MTTARDPADIDPNHRAHAAPARNRVADTNRSTGPTLTDSEILRRQAEQAQQQ